MRRFYPVRYHTKKYRDEWAEDMSWDYTRAVIVRKEPFKDWGFCNVIGFYADYIKRVNKRKPKR
jgi:hypothetical protein